MTGEKSRRSIRSGGKKNHSRPRIIPDAATRKSCGDLVHAGEIARDILDELRQRFRHDQEPAA